MIQRLIPPTLHRECCPSGRWTLHLDNCPIEIERIARIKAQAMRDHSFIGEGQYCESWSSPSSAGDPATTGVVTMRVGCGYPREHHPVDTSQSSR